MRNHLTRSRRALRLGVPFLALALLGAAPVTNGPVATRVTYELLDARVMAGSQLPRGPMAYLVTPPGHTFRTLGSQPILDADGTKLGTLVSYKGDTRDPEAATAEALELMGAIGPEWQRGGETAVLVQARVGFDPRKRFNSTVGFHTCFHLKDGRWARLPEPPRRPGLPKSIGTGPLEVVDDPDFPFDGKGLAEAAQVAGRWMAALDRGDASALRQEMSESYASELESTKAHFERFVAERAVSKRDATHRELYRVQMRNGGRVLPGGRGILLLYDADAGRFGRSLEQVALAQEKGRWRVSTFLSQSFRKVM